MAGKQNEISSQTALELLQDGNANYVSDLMHRPNATRRRRLETGSGQWPFAIVLACADSRVTPEQIFDQGIGDIFVARIAGNVATSEVIGSIQYAVQYIKTELVVVLGHESCGAVGAAISPPDDAPKELGGLVGQIQESIGREKKIQKAVEKNAKAQASLLRKALKGSAMKHAKVCAATYGLRSGEVSWL
jgi:carbonic anhydrase